MYLTLFGAGFLFGVALSMHRIINKICNENISDITIIDMTKEDITSEDFIYKMHKRAKEDIEKMNFYSSVQRFNNVIMIAGTIVYFISVFQYCSQV